MSYDDAVAEVERVRSRLDAALDALAECRKKRDHYRTKARDWQDQYYNLLRITAHEPPAEEPVDMEGPSDD